jgi:hypothetical protein
MARWDANVEIDGLAVRVLPLDEYGAVTPVDGTLEVELIAEPVAWGRPLQFPPPDTPPVSLGRWQQAVCVRDFGPSGAVYRLRYQGANPELERRWSNFAAVHVRLSVPGQGVFEATQDGVQIRLVSPTRDQLEQSTGHRWFPQERTGDGRR